MAYSFDTAAAQRIGRLPRGFCGRPRGADARVPPGDHCVMMKRYETLAVFARTGGHNRGAKAKASDPFI
jgi:hypothetical protein